MKHEPEEYKTTKLYSANARVRLQLLTKEGTCMSEQNLDFALHIHKIAADAEHHDLYTIGVWKGTRATL